MYDFIIVGAGTAGCALASRLARSSSKPSVLLLECGDKNNDISLRIAAEKFTTFMTRADVLDRGYKTMPQKELNGRQIPYARGKGLGGSTANNICVWDYGSPEELDFWARLVGDDTWTWEKSLEAMQRIENYHYRDMPLEHQKYVSIDWASHGNQGPVDITVPLNWEPGLKMILDAAAAAGMPLTLDRNSSKSLGFFVPAETIHNGIRITAASAYLSERPDNLVVQTSSEVAQILFEDKKAVGVKLVDGTKCLDPLLLLSKMEVILSAGSLDTPKLLLLSGIGPVQALKTFDIPVVSNLPGVGTNLGDHISAGIVYTLKSGSLLNYGVDASARELWTKDRAGPFGESKGILALGYFKLDSVTSSNEFQTLEPDVQELLLRANTPVYELSMRVTPLESGSTRESPDHSSAVPALGLRANVILHHAQSKGTVTLKSPDPTDSPLIDVNYLTHPYDRRALLEAYKATMKFLESSSLPLEKMIIGPKDKSDEAIIEFFKNNVGTVWHVMGTAKMGKAEDVGTCVDPDFRVFGVQNLRVVDMSVAPVLVSNHTQSTAYLIGENAAVKIIEEYKLN